MTDFTVISTVQAIAGDRFLCTVSAVPTIAKDDGHDVETESRVLSSYGLALECCSEMVRAMANRIERRGGAVSKTEMRPLERTG